MIDFQCPKCGQRMSAPESRADQAETCPRCGNVAVVPGPQTQHVPPGGDADSPAGDERILYRGQPSHWAYCGFYAFAAVIALIALALLLLVPRWPAVLSVCMLISGPAVAALGLTDRKATHFRVTTRTVSLRRGIFAREVTEIPIDSIREVRLKQGVLDRLAGVGTVGFSTASTAEVEVNYRGVRDPDALRRLVLAELRPDRGD